MEYPYVVKTAGETKTVLIQSPLKWVLSYSDFTPGRMKQLLADPHRSDSDASRFVFALPGVVRRHRTADPTQQVALDAIPSGRIQTSPVAC